MTLHHPQESETRRLPQREIRKSGMSGGVSPERTGGALERVPRGSALGHGLGRRPRGVRLPALRTSNAGDTPGMRPPMAWQPKRGRLRFGMRSLGAAPRPIGAFSFRSQRPSSPASQRDPPDDRESEPPSEHRIPPRGATSPPVRADPTQRERPRSPWMGPLWKILIASRVIDFHSEFSQCEPGSISDRSAGGRRPLRPATNFAAP